MPIATIEELRREVERQYVGFSPNTHSVKPVHIANGLFRTLLGHTSNTRTLFRFVFSETSKGMVPRHHDLDSVYNDLRGDGRLDPDEVVPEDLARLRVLLKKVVGADNAVFDTSMDSYSAGNESFVSRDTIGQEGGELLAEWLRRRSPELAARVVETLRQRGDVITQLCAPLLRPDDQVLYSPGGTDGYDYDRVGFLATPPAGAAGRLYDGLAEAADTLATHLDRQDNPLFRLRLTVLFISFVLIRHLSALESCYVPGAQETVPPFLLDCSPPHEHDGPLARASTLTYTRACQSLARFYAWAFGARLRDRYSDPAILAQEAPPDYKRHATVPDATEVWGLATEESVHVSDPYTVYGQAIYDLLAAMGKYSPISYLRMLGVRSGVLYPASNAQPAKRFSLQQDMLETLVRSTVLPPEVVDMPDLQERLWRRFGLVIGGRPEDEQRLIDAGVAQADADALAENRHMFVVALGRLDFARLLADGVLQVAI